MVSAGVGVAFARSAQPFGQSRAINSARHRGLSLRFGARLCLSFTRLLLASFAQQDFGVGDHVLQLRYGKMIQNYGHKAVL